MGSTAHGQKSDDDTVMRQAVKRARADHGDAIHNSPSDERRLPTLASDLLGRGKSINRTLALSEIALQSPHGLTTPANVSAAGWDFLVS